MQAYPLGSLLAGIKFVRIWMSKIQFADYLTSICSARTLINYFSLPRLPLLIILSLAD